MCFLSHTCYHYFTAQERIWNRNLPVLEIHEKKKKGFLSLFLKAEETLSEPRTFYRRGEASLKSCCVGKMGDAQTKQKQKLHGFGAPSQRKQLQRWCGVGCEVLPNWLHVWTLGPQLVTLFGEAVGSFRSGVELEDVGPRGAGLNGCSLFCVGLTSVSWLLPTRHRQLPPSLLHGPCNASESQARKDRSSCELFLSGGFFFFSQECENSGFGRKNLKCAGFEGKSKRSSLYLNI